MVRVTARFGSSDPRTGHNFLFYLADLIPNPVLIPPNPPALTPNPSPKLGRGEPEPEAKAGCEASVSDSRSSVSPTVYERFSSGRGYANETEGKGVLLAIGNLSELDLVSEDLE